MSVDSLHALQCESGLHGGELRSRTDVDEGDKMSFSPKGVHLACIAWQEVKVIRVQTKMVVAIIKVDGIMLSWGRGNKLAVVSEEDRGPLRVPGIPRLQRSIARVVNIYRLDMLGPLIVVHNIA